ncbi:TRAP transporter large permease [Pseudactinotalea sp.]|uniref:TRAP transporter large permease n=1 Tax=Pseudactinotalea sp. TaxID=1926260 RepID=UPI003B3B2566
MEPTVLATIILLGGMVLLLIVSVPVAVAIGLPAAAAAIVLVGFDQAALVSAQRVFAGSNSFALLAIPFFVLAGSLMNAGGMATRLIDLALVIAGRAPASLAQTTVVANTLFGAVSGASVASAATVGTVLGPRMKKEGYDPRFAAAVNVSASPAGMLLPPSNTFIVYALVSSSSIAALFMAGVGPGLLWSLACMVVVGLYARKHPELRGKHRATLKEALLVLWRAVPSLLMIVVVVGGILAGVFTATESAVIAVVYALVFGLAKRAVKVRELPEVVLHASRTTGIIMLLVGVSAVLSWVMSYARIPQQVSEAMLQITDSPIAILLIITLVLLIAGTVMDPTPAILIFTPILLPIVVELGVHPVHFGVMIVFNMSLGNITPPVGNNLFVGARVAGLRVEPVVAKMVPFFIALTIALLVTVFWPALSMWLPTQLGLVTP